MSKQLFFFSLSGQRKGQKERERYLRNIDQYAQLTENKLIVILKWLYL